MRVRDVVDLGTVCPTQFEAVTVNGGQAVYIRYRHGILSMDLGVKRIYRMEVKSEADGDDDITWDEVKRHIGLVEVVQ